jgi:hypothetical protein
MPRGQCRAAAMSRRLAHVKRMILQTEPFPPQERPRFFFCNAALPEQQGIRQFTLHATCAGRFSSKNRSAAAMRINAA